VENSLGLEFLPPTGDGDARRLDVRRASVGGGTACQSAISQPTQSLDPIGKEKQGVRFEVWKGGNKVKITPRKSVLPPTEKKFDRDAPIRGNVTACTWRSMSRLKSFLAEVRCDVPAYTFCLTYPNVFPKAWVAKKHFQQLRNCIRKKYRQYGMVWKREPQTRGATHFHILAFLEADFYLSKEVGDYILKKWCEIVSGEGTEYSVEDHEKQLAVHTYFDPKELEPDYMPPRNQGFKNAFQRMHGKSFFDYLGKYIAKDSGDVPEGYENEGGGLWWNKINKESIPMAEKKERVVSLAPDREKSLFRILYKLRDMKKQKRLDKLHFVVSNPRLAAEELERAMRKKNPEMNPLEARKRARYITFKMDGSRFSTAAPIKAKKSYWYGAIQFLGYPKEITDLIRKILEPPPVDVKARARIFSDSYTPKL
jgi:hypothetical protein